jgi:hypothetical protein
LAIGGCGDGVEEPSFEAPPTLSVVVSGTVEANGEPQPAQVKLFLLASGPPCEGAVLAGDSVGNDPSTGRFTAQLIGDTTSNLLEDQTGFAGCLHIRVRPLASALSTFQERSDVWLRPEAEQDTVGVFLDVSDLLATGAR